MIILVCGSRDYFHINDKKRFNKYMTDLVKDKNTTIYSGGARGIDTWASRWAENNNIRKKIFIADWSKGKAAGYMRNAEMFNDAVNKDNDVLVLAFWDNQSKGTKHMIDLAQRNNVQVNIINLKDLPIK